MRKRVLSLCMALVLCLSLLPIPVVAAEEAGDSQPETAKVNAETISEVTKEAAQDADFSDFAELMASVTYAPYYGVDYTNVNLSSDRMAALNKAKQMVTIQWTAIESFRTWCSSQGSYNSAKATDGSSSTYFVKGKTYTGIPYSMKDHSFDDTKWANYVANGSITASNMNGTYYDHGKTTTAHGIDCSYFVYMAIRAAVGSSNISYQTTATMLNSSYYQKLNGISNMIPGDLFLKSGHVMMYVGKSGSKYAVFEADAGDSKCSYNEYTTSYLSSYGSYRYKGFGSEPIPDSQYFPRCASSCTTITEGLNNIGVDSSYSYRAKIAAVNGIDGYTGTAEQNTRMLNMLKAGTLKRPGSLSLTFSPSSLELKPGESQTVTVRFSGDGIQTLHFEIENTNVAL